MPYVAKAEAKRARWMTLAEAVAHVCESDGCTAKAAEVQLRKALGDGTIMTWWGDQPLPPPRGSPPTIQPDDAPSARPGHGTAYWQSVQIRGAEVFDPPDSALTDVARAMVGAAKVGWWRVLLVLRHSVTAIWVAPAVASVPAGAALPRIGRPTRRADIDRVLHDADPNLPTGSLITLVMNELGTDKGLSERTIRRRIEAQRNR